MLAPSVPVRAGAPSRVVRGATLALTFWGLAVTASAQLLTLSDAERIALADEPGLQARERTAAALRERAVADGQLPDPELSATALNFPVDGFDFDQEPITQLRFGVRQRIPGGDERSARSAVTESRAGVVDAEALARVRDVRRAVGRAMAALAFRLTERAELEEATTLIADVEQAGLAGYRQGRGAQQDVLRARLEQQVLRDRLRENGAAIDLARADLARWIGPRARDAEPAFELPSPAPADELERLATHPRLQTLRAAETVAERSVALARTDYAPDWSVEVAWGVRDELSLVGDRPDFLSAGVSVELPLFTAQRQDRRLAASEGEREAARARSLDALRALRSELERARAREAELLERLAIHDEDLLPLARENVDAARSGLSGDIVDYAEVVRAALAEIELGIARARLERQLRDARLDLAWLLGGASAGNSEEQVR